jgi:Flp pilus assembly protein TadG
MSNLVPDSRARAVCSAIRRFVYGDDAGPMVEFALVAPMLMLIILAIADFSLASLKKSNLVSAAREGARFGATQMECPSGATDFAELVKQRVIANFSQTSGTLPANLAPQVTVTCTAEKNIEVRVNYNYSPVTPIWGVLNLFVGNATTIPLSAIAVYRWERS